LQVPGSGSAAMARARNLTYCGPMADTSSGGADPEVMEMYDDSRAELGLICRVCGCLVAQAGEYPRAHWDWHEATNGA
jgi:hypothetical protein